MTPTACLRSVEPGPNVADWITALSTTVAVIAAIVAGAIAGKAYQLEHRANSQRDADRRAEQASRVAAWVERRPSAMLVREGAAGPGDFCVLVNTSALPVYDVLLIYRLLGGPGEINAGTAHEKVLSPSTEERVFLIPNEVLREWNRHQDTHPTMRVDIRFTDSASRRWWRGHDGVLADKGPWKQRPPESAKETYDDPAGDAQH
ncbi:hypothetical protein [Jiangella muralis]|uniref:hypothetical protein n=1 Tax=Jiangella muralis TaxID=702383 RepID=UPI00069F271F|nr:hypothetical protein [Jiangella muralis]